MQLFKKDFEKLFTENETRANITQTYDWVQKLCNWRIFYVTKHYNCKAPQFFCSSYTEIKRDKKYVRDWEVLSTQKSIMVF